MLSIDGVHIEKDLGLHLLADSDEPILSETRDNVVVIPGKHGAIPFAADLEPKPFLERILIPSQASLEDVQIITRQISGMVLDDYGRPKDVKLKYDYEPDKYYIARFSGSISIDRIARTGIFAIPFTAYDPMAKFMVPSDEITWDSDIPFMSDILWNTGLTSFEINSPQTFEVINNGTIVIRASFTMSGSGTNVKLTANGQEMNFGTFSNTTFDIKGDDYNIFRNGIEDLVTPYFIDLLPGENNIQVTGSNLNLTISESLIYQYK